MNAAVSFHGLELRHEAMAKHTSWRVGGPADRIYRPVGIEDLAAYLACLPDNEPLVWCGLGSNLLVRDGGIRGTVIQTQFGLAAIRRLDEERIYVEAGVPCAKVARFSARADLINAEFLAGIPGTMGGALAMNAGAFGGETWPIVESVQTVDRRGVLRHRDAHEFEIAYRHVGMPAEEWFVSATLKLEIGDGGAAQERIRELLAKRAASQPMGLPSCGSVFRNPEGDYAARLIEQAGLKGRRIGGAEISGKHANFIINTGEASADDIEALMALARDTVKDKFGIELWAEVRVVGEEAS